MDIQEAKKKLKEMIWHDKRVVAVGIMGEGIEVGVSSFEVLPLIPDEIEGWPVITYKQGPIELQGD